jgi:ATP-dependent DNA helicase PIF1
MSTSSGTGERSGGMILSPEMMARIERNRAAAVEKRKRMCEETSHAKSAESLRDHLCTTQPVAACDVRIKRPSHEIAFIQGEMPVLQAASSSSFDAGAAVSRASAAQDSIQQLSPEQEYVHKEVLAGKSVFLTGCGGTGKSFLTNQLIVALKKSCGNTTVAVTASTGIAACQIGGTSLHNFAGIGLGNGTVDQLVERVSKNKRVCDRWKKTKCLVIDEVSMLDGELFDKLEALARNVRKNDKPFGGIQLLLVGDFLQLPPIKKNGNVQFCFEARTWKQTVQLNVELKTVFRQRNAEFVDMLNSIRRGICSPQMVASLCATKHNLLNETNGVLATRLYPTNADVDRINNLKVDQLPGEMFCFTADDSGESPFLENLDKSCLAPQKLCIKPGAQVMLLKNLDTEAGLTNGTRGFVESIVESDEQGRAELIPIVRFEVNKDTTVISVRKVFTTKEVFSVESFGKVVASRTQYPLRLAYAITIHKCQGMTLNKVELSLGGVFECGQAYVALSRASDMQGLRLLDFNASVVRAHPRVLEFYRLMEQNQTIDSSWNHMKRERLLPQFSAVSKQSTSSGESRENPLFTYDD